MSDSELETGKPGRSRQYLHRRSKSQWSRGLTFLSNLVSTDEEARGSSELTNIPSGNIVKPDNKMSQETSDPSGSSSTPISTVTPKEYYSEAYKKYRGRIPQSVCECVRMRASLC